jgi:glycosyltransferase involved in cell wall biosynthesis
MARILFVTERYYPDIGGLARSGQRIASTLAELGHSVEVFALSAELESGQASSEKVSNNLTVHHFGRSKQIDFTLQQAMIFLEWLHTRNDGKQPIDLVWSHYAMSNGYFGIWFAKHFGLKSILAVRGNDVDRQILPPGDLSRLNWSLQNATQVVAVSSDLAAKVKTISDVSAQVLPNSVDAQVFCSGKSSEALREKYKIAAEQLVLVFSGELRAKKGLPMLIECYRQLAIKRPTKLLIIGDVRVKEKGRFQKETAGLPAAKRDIVCTGHLPELADVVEHLRLGDVFVLPSLWDGLPNSLLEAMAVGIPVIASDAGAIGEVITDGQNGIMIPRTHLHQMANKIEHFLSKPAAERNEMATRARSYVEEYHSPVLERKRLELLIRDTLEK